MIVREDSEMESIPNSDFRRIFLETTGIQT